MPLELEGTRVVHIMDPTRVGTIVARSRCACAHVVRWDHSGSCSVVPCWLWVPEDWKVGASDAILRSKTHRDRIEAWRESGKEGPA
jgi:hypothetical protein